MPGFFLTSTHGTTEAGATGDVWTGNRVRMCTFGTLTLTEHVDMQEVLIEEDKDPDADEEEVEDLRQQLHGAV